ncbi:MAG: hypothetical protein IPQ08_06735 [Chitinophagaceae bacterium]|nr:hypothetical protein [Chitinophagaceae bacterium]
MGTKIRLSAEEKRLLQTERFILTKNRILQKAMLLFGELKTAFDQQLNGIDLPVGTASAKISKGENYQGLPWIMLDHPRYFNKEETIAIRSFFWWGNFFSITLQLSGEAKQTAAPKIIQQFKKLRKGGYAICVNNDPWQHDMEKGNYRSLKKMKQKDFITLIEEKAFIKLAACIELKKWEKMKKPMTAKFSELVNFLR